MPARKIADLPTDHPCVNAEHNPPTMMFFEPGVYEHECPACGAKVIFKVTERTMCEPTVWRSSRPGGRPLAVFCRR